MSIINVRAALESALAAIYPSIDTAHENVAFTPSVGVPYQSAHLLLADPDDSERDSPPKERGIFQINLVYPIEAGTYDANLRAELIRSIFYKKATFLAGGERVIVEKTPSVRPGYMDGDRWVIPVRIDFFVN